MVDQPKDTEKPLSMRALTEKVAAGVGVLVADAEKRNAPKPETSRPAYTEADALRDCLLALQRLKDSEAVTRRSSSHDYMLVAQSGWSSWSTAERILRYLAGTFGVNLIETRQPDCDRIHVDQLNPDMFMSALRSAAVSQ